MSLLLMLLWACWLALELERAFKRPVHKRCTKKNPLYR